MDFCDLPIRYPKWTQGLAISINGGFLNILYKKVIRPLIFKFDAERSHNLVNLALRLPFVWSFWDRLSSNYDFRLETSLAGLTLPSPIGLAAGFDKECQLSNPILQLGFGYLTVGTVTKGARPGNPTPRLLRQVDQLALINSLGFPGPGLAVAEARLRKQINNRRQVFVSVSGIVEDEIIECHRKLQKFSAATELNISSPNTAGLKVFHDPGRLHNLVQALNQQKTVPLFVKIPPWNKNDHERRDALRLVETSTMAGADGLVVANTRPTEHSMLAAGHGGLSGVPLISDTERMVAESKAAVGADVPIIASGGVSNALDIWRLIGLGASCVQLYTAFVYEGPNLARRLNKDLIKMMDSAGISSINDIRGAKPV